MKPKDSKERLFEVVARLDKTFKPKLNENMGATINEEARPLYDIAREIRKDWRPVHPYAEPYVSAMSSLSSINDKYMFDSGTEIVGRFLSNASSWRGETAKRIKTELKQMLGLKEEESEPILHVAKSGRKYRSIPDDVDVETWDKMSVPDRMKHKGMLQDPPKGSLSDKLFQASKRANTGNVQDEAYGYDDDDEDDPDAGHTVNGKLLTPEEYRKWKEEEGEYDDMDRERYPRRRY